MNSARIIITCFALLFVFNAHAQLKPLAGLELLSSNETVMRVQGREFKYQAGDMALIYGLQYSIKKVELRAMAETLMYINTPVSYSPTHSEFTVSAGYRFNNFRVKLQHMCLHPVENYHTTQVKLFKGHTKLGVYLNL